MKPTIGRVREIPIRAIEKCTREDLEETVTQLTNFELEWIPIKVGDEYIFFDRNGYVEHEDVFKQVLRGVEIETKGSQRIIDIN